MSTSSVTLKITVGLCIAGVCLAQNWEAGGGAGYGWYYNATINSPAGSATAGFRNRVVATGVLTENMYQHFSGEIRYLYSGGDTFLASGPVSGGVRAQSHSIGYDVLFNFTPREARLRPFLAGGAGAKFYDTTGSVPIPQPLPRIATLTSNSEWKPLFNFGAGIKFRAGDHIILRADIRDYITPFPGDLFVHVLNGSARGVIHQLTPMLGISVGF